jgi:alkanesulfonate monooxygenase SsuD/methylene tetrahydromethanopterin reductase-like flavin-dependent oxidoreductase (luciferase family)
LENQIHPRESSAERKHLPAVARHRNLAASSPIEVAELYRRSAVAAGREPGQIGVTSHFYVEETLQGAKDTFFPHCSSYIGQNMPRAGRLDRPAFETWASPRGALFAGSPAEIVEKILWEHEILGHTRFLAQVGLGGLSQAQTLRSIELLATEVLPAVRAALKQ